MPVAKLVAAAAAVTATRVALVARWMAAVGMEQQQMPPVAVVLREVLVILGGAVVEAGKDLAVAGPTGMAAAAAARQTV
jgi:hypothetical protein